MKSRHFWRSTALLGVLMLISSVSLWAASPAPSDLARTDYGTGVSKKLGRGLANLAFGWLDIPKGIEDVWTENNGIAGLTWGPIYGTGRAVVRTLAGAYETITFPFPGPQNFEPLVTPEFVLEKSR